MKNRAGKGTDAELLLQNSANSDLAGRSNVVLGKSNIAGQGAEIAKVARAFVRQRSGLHLDLLDPNPASWTDEDLAIGLSRTFRWGGHTLASFQFPLSVAQHSLTVTALAANRSVRPITRRKILLSLLHDSSEGLIGGFDAITPLKPFLGEGFAEVDTKLQKAVFQRYGLSDWTPAEYREHKRLDVLAAASEAVHVAGWRVDELRDTLGIDVDPLENDPLVEIYGGRPWEPWPLEVAAARFLAELTGKLGNKFVGT